VKLWPTHEARVEDNGLAAALEDTRTFLLDAVLDGRVGYVRDLVGVGGRACNLLWTEAPALDRSRLAMRATGWLGAAPRVRDVSAGALAAELVREIEDRLRWYWLAWEVPDGQRVGEHFVKIELAQPAGRRVRPDRISDDRLLGEFPYHVIHAGELDGLDWAFRSLLFPEEADLAFRLAAALGAVLPEHASVVEGVSCPVLFRLDSDWIGTGEGARRWERARRLLVGAGLEQELAEELGRDGAWLDPCELARRMLPATG
jgi:hypothetical protein